MSGRPGVIAIAGERIEAGQNCMISPDGKVVPWRTPPFSPGQKVRVTLEGIVDGVVAGDDWAPVRLPLFHGTWRVPLDAIEATP